MAEALVTLRGVEAGYPPRQILFGIDLAVDPGEVVALLGANGSGKSTLLNTLSGFVRPWAGSIRFAGAEIAGVPPHRTFRRGIVQVSQARDLFPLLSVEDNLKLGGRIRGGAVADRLARVYDAFPRLKERRRQPVHLMSGGEQQMVAIGRALMGEPRLLLLDEPSGGLAPRLVGEIAQTMRQLKERGMTLLMVEQNLKLALAIADRFLILRDGRVAERGDIRAAPDQEGAAQEEAIVRSIYL